MLPDSSNGRKMYKCQYCEREFSDQKVLDWHLNRRHKGMSDIPFKYAFTSDCVYLGT